ncbi:leucine-rich repeat protein [Butyrivibrio sp. WCD2001]|uniref:leucine-rich repeat protein n=1 Tax=Butyrivibrio sp. WCD2001 TaxID=1280681 RepID=UPI00040616D3|nr:leucine-rich repeat domain-containing protein [Butyrivibrio sp. WCD2001]
MKKVVKRICNTLMAVAVATSMLSFVGTQASAAEEVNDTVVEEANDTVEEVYTDTVEMDFSENRIYRYNKEQPSSEDLDNDVLLRSLSPEEKNIVFINAMNYYNNLFTISYDRKTQDSNGNVINAEGDIIIDSQKGQIIHFTTDKNATEFDAKAASGVFKTVITRSSLRAGTKNDVDLEMPFFGAQYMYNAKASTEDGEPYFILIINFGENYKKSKEETPAPAPVKEEEKTTKEETTAPSTEKKEDQQKTTETEQKAPETEKKAETVETAALDTEFEENGYSYKVTADGEVSFVTVADKKVKSVNIPDSVTHQNVEYKVTSVADKALYNCSKLKNVTVGANVKTIGASAFAKSKKLKTVTIKSASLTSIGKKAFSKNDKKIVVKVSKANYKKYKKLMKKAGMSSVKLKKIGK